MITHRQIALALVALFMASCHGTSGCILCGPFAANLEGTVSGLVGYRLQLQNGSTLLNSSLNGTGANGGGITGRARADDDDVVFIAHISSTMRAGSSRACLTVTRNCTASRPSMMR